jgi:septum formation protein
MKIILASTSPRRIDLMEQARIHVEVISPRCEELTKRGESPARMVRRLALEKAQSVASLPETRVLGPVVVIAADTTVVAPGGKRILGKPVDVRDAERMLKLISGKTHEVLTGYCLLGWNEKGRAKTWSRVVRSKVTMRKVSTAMIRDYIASGEPMDKAGSYAAQGFGMNWIQSLRGSYTNVVGLPMCELLTDLEEKFGVLPRSRLEG